MNIKALRGLLIKRGVTQKQAAEIIGISQNTFSRRMRDESFGSEEMDALVRALRLDRPEKIFFSKK